MRSTLQVSSLIDQLDERLDAALADIDTPPTTLHRAMRHAVFPGGKRFRPRLLLTVSAACAAGAAEAELALVAACAVELIHSASLVHDDLPCFDDAGERRGRPAVHALFGERMAVLAGDALLTRAFELMAETPPQLAQRSLHIVRQIGQATGSRHGIIGGQSLEERLPLDATPMWGPDPRALVDRYHAMKTAALFRLAAGAGATAAGADDIAEWAELGQCLGLAYQLADDLCDVYASRKAAGKPVRRDAALGRPNVVLRDGQGAVRERLSGLIDQARERVAALDADAGLLTDLCDDLVRHFNRFTSRPIDEGAAVP